jgi:hypothetical protein
MVSKRVVVGIALAGAAAAAAGTYSYNHIQQQRSLRQGIAQTQQALAKVDELLEENQTEIVKRISSVEVDLGEKLEELPQVNATPNQQVTPLGNAIDLFRTASNGFVGARAFQNRDYLQATGQTAEAVAAVWGKFDPRVELGAKAIDVAANLYEAQALLRQQERLVATQGTLQQQLLRLQGKDPQTAAEWERILNNLHGDGSAEHGAYLNWLAAKNLSEKDVLAKAFTNAANAQPGVASQFTSGLKIVDPSQNVSDLSNITDINPDFIAAVQCNSYVATQAISDPRWLRFTCTHYPEDGTYIPAFGPCRGIDFANPFTGGVIPGGSTAVCGSRSRQLKAGSNPMPATGNDQLSPKEAEPQVGYLLVIGTDSKPYVAHGNWDFFVSSPDNPMVGVSGTLSSFRRNDGAVALGPGRYSIEVGPPGAHCLKDPITIHRGETTTLQVGSLLLPALPDPQESEQYEFVDGMKYRMSGAAYEIDNLNDESCGGRGPSVVASPVDLLPDRYIVKWRVELCRGIGCDNWMVKAQKIFEVLPGRTTVVGF